MYENARDEYEVILEESKGPRAEFPGSSSEEEEPFSSPASKKPTDSKSKTPVLDNFGRQQGPTTPYTTTIAVYIIRRSRRCT